MLIGNSLWHLIKQSDTVSITVLLALLCISLVCWTIFFCKLLVFTIKSRHLKEATKRIYDTQTTEDLRALTSLLHNTLPGYFLAKQLMFIKPIMQARLDNTGFDAVFDREVVRSHAEQQLDLLISHQDSYLSMLSTSAAVAPLLGLFGTIWGLVQAFISISERQTADIVAVAPGIAQALITTLAGLLVAIPALVMFNFLHTRAQRLEQELIAFVDTAGFHLQRITHI